METNNTYTIGYARKLEPDEGPVEIEVRPGLFTTVFRKPSETPEDALRREEKMFPRPTEVEEAAAHKALGDRDAQAEEWNVDGRIERLPEE